MKHSNCSLFSAALICAALLTPLSSTMAADHLDAPSLSQNGQVDVNDLFAFQSPANADNTVLILTVNPGAGVLSPTDFGNNVAYQFQVDNTGDAIADITYEATFSGAGAAQTFNLTRTENGITVPQATGLSGSGTGVATASGGQVSTGVFDDPFFFDLEGFNDGFNFTTGDDFFAGLDVGAIVLEVPSTDLNGASSSIGVQGRTLLNGTQVDRIGRPAINTALIVGDAQKEAFNLGNPEDDFAAFGSNVQDRIEVLNGGDTGTAAALTPILLPDLLTFDTSSANGFVESDGTLNLNGRRLSDNVIDAELNLLTNGIVPSDGVFENDREFLNVFPFLASSNASVVPEPSALMPIALVFGACVTRRRRRS